MTATQLYELQQHIGWLKIYVESTTAANWLDMRDNCARQLAEVAKDLAALAPSGEKERE